MGTHHGWLAVALMVVGIAVAGCLADKPTAYFVVSERSFPTSPAVNLTEDEVAAYPIVKQLIDKWEASGRSYSYTEPYSYEEGLAVVKSIQDKLPGATWPYPHTVTIAYNGSQLDVGISKVEGHP